MIWFALAIPVAAILIMFFFFKERIVWWEIVIPIPVCLLSIIISKYTTEYAQTRDTEYWTGWAKQARYYEEWTEEWDDYVTETDSNGNTTTRVEHHVEYHSPYWELEDSNNITIRISKQKYNELARRWNNNKEEKLFRMNQTSFGDGDVWKTNWDNKRESMEVVTTPHWYENRVIVSHSVFNYPEVKDKKGLFEYPKQQLDTPSILGASDRKANRYLCEQNALLGKRKQVRMMILVFHNQPMEKALDQEAYWKGGNKNELILCLGVNQNQVKWAHCFSWTESERLKIDLQNFAKNQESLDLMQIAEFMSEQTIKQWKRKHFSDFAYLSVQPPWWAILITYSITLAITVGFTLYAIFNEFDEVTHRRKQWKRR
jgi:hypothetical protein